MNMIMKATDPIEVVRTDCMSWLKEGYTISIMNVLDEEVDIKKLTYHLNLPKGRDPNS